MRLARPNGERWLDAAAEAAATLDDRLLRPLDLPPEARLVVVPSRSLHGVPWRALPSLAGRPVTVAPSAALGLRAAARREGSSTQRLRRRSRAPRRRGRGRAARGRSRGSGARRRRGDGRRLPRAGRRGRRAPRRRPRLAPGRQPGVLLARAGRRPADRLRPRSAPGRPRPRRAARVRRRPGRPDRRRAGRRGAHAARPRGPGGRRARAAGARPRHRPPHVRRPPPPGRRRRPCGRPRRGRRRPRSRPRGRPPRRGGLRLPRLRSGAGRAQERPRPSQAFWSADCTPAVHSSDQNGVDRGQAATSRRSKTTMAIAAAIRMYVATVARARYAVTAVVPPAAKASRRRPGNQRPAGDQAFCTRCSNGPAHAMPTASATGTERTRTREGRRRARRTR